MPKTPRTTIPKVGAVVGSGKPGRQEQHTYLADSSSRRSDGAGRSSLRTSLLFLHSSHCAEVISHRALYDDDGAPRRDRGIPARADVDGLGVVLYDLNGRPTGRARPEIVRIATSIIRTAGGDADLNGTVHATGALRL